MKRTNIKLIKDIKHNVSYELVNFIPQDGKALDFFDEGIAAGKYVKKFDHSAGYSVYEAV